jgi:protein gp37
MTKIEWTRRPGGPRGKSWNPWWGCDKIAPECGLPAPGNPMPEGGGCYAAIFASRNLHAIHIGVAKKGEWTGLLTRASESHRKAPFSYPPGTLCFTCSQSDFWHERVPLLWLAEALDVIEATRWVTYQILTKRPGMIKRRLADLGRRWPDNARCGVTLRTRKIVAAVAGIAPNRRAHPVLVRRAVAGPDGAGPRSYRY